MPLLTSKEINVRFGVGFPTVIIEERINPTNKKSLAEELREGKFDLLKKRLLNKKKLELNKFLYQKK